MDFGLPPPPEVRDRRVQRSRAALLSAAVRLVGERGTTALSATELAEAADVSRRVLYLHFGDRDGLLIAAAVELVTRELLPQLPPNLDDTRTALAVSRHFAERRPFYRPLLTGSCAYAAIRTVVSLFRPHSLAGARELFGDLDDRAVGEVADFFTGAMAMALTEWLVDGPTPPDPDGFAERLLRIQSLLAGARGGPGRSHTEDPA
ncbi:TetR/AcrR family transcriptional regulator [Streptomyces chromofuscus]|uniref:TetR/AcrR family transcriptional regulator n=1 Tax=Streptomyces chromofuscus TaxID=42881 RepID=A0A7M2TA16_STRCW|nr:TetR/AcrR family transcriptional regulator [Streptomyces chromofuscus]QOV44785.1 TetR/AcrR family transcriptional regulator [Streptomyces chromofuscus]GGT00220.1 TetR family transcriptional regulator [Streptomyces chromofuscus]